MPCSSLYRWSSCQVMLRLYNIFNGISEVCSWACVPIFKVLVVVTWKWPQCWVVVCADHLSLWSPATLRMLEANQIFLTWHSRRVTMEMTVTCIHTSVHPKYSSCNSYIFCQILFKFCWLSCNDMKMSLCFLFLILSFSSWTLNIHSQFLCLSAIFPTSPVWFF